MLSFWFFFCFFQSFGSNFTIAVRSLLTDAKFCFFYWKESIFLKLDYDDNQYNWLALSGFFFWCSFYAASQITYTPIYQSKWQEQQQQKINMLMFPLKIIVKPHKKSTLEIVFRLDQPGNPVR